MVQTNTHTNGLFCISATHNSGSVLEFRSSVEGATRDESSDTVLDGWREAEPLQLLLKLFQCAIASTVAIESGRSVRGDELLVCQLQGLENVPLLTEEVLLVVTT